MAAETGPVVDLSGLCTQIDNTIKYIARNWNFTSKDVETSCNVVEKVVKVVEQLAKLVDYKKCATDKLLDNVKVARESFKLLDDDLNNSQIQNLQQPFTIKKFYNLCSMVQDIKDLRKTDVYKAEKPDVKRKNEVTLLAKFIHEACDLEIEQQSDLNIYLNKELSQSQASNSSVLQLLGCVVRRINNSRIQKVSPMDETMDKYLEQLWEEIASHNKKNAFRQNRE